jgi:NAD(P)-dependent dehydrogenase (short-subunit alcohol dehydrogenase family)
VPLTGRRAVVTGAAGGIGRAVVHALVAQGALVHGLDIRLPDPHGAHNGPLGHTDDRVVMHRVDLADRADTDRVLGRLAADLGGVCDILVNGAGISRVRSFDASDDALLDSILAVNFTAAFRVTRALQPALRASGRGSIVNIASELALVGQAGYGAYSASKGALLAWSRALAVELAGERIRVNAVCPGPVDTAMLAGEFATSPDPGRARREEIGTIPAGRLGVPSEIASVIAFLAGDAAAYVTGAAWSVDGGKTAR